MQPKSSKQGRDVKLPEGVSLHEWSLEKSRWQNPRIRAFLGCIRVLDEVFESNYAILHCSPKRLDEIWEQVQEISKILRHEVAPLLSAPSKIPDLEEARESATVYFEALDKSVLEEIAEFPKRLEEQHHAGVRKLLCVAIGQLHAFLLDTLGEILARDPRSHTDVDYFLTRKFARDVDEAEWLHTSVARLEEFLLGFGRAHSPMLSEIGEGLSGVRRLPTSSEWEKVSTYLHSISGDLVSRLKMVLGLRGIRLSELELLDQRATNLPALAKTLEELYSAAHQALASLNDELDDQDDGLATGHQTAQLVEGVFSDRILALMRELNDQVRDLTTYLPVWRQCIEQRRAMMLKRSQVHEPSGS